MGTKETKQNTSAANILASAIKEMASDAQEHSKCSACEHNEVCRYRCDCESAVEWALCRYWKQAS